MPASLPIKEPLSTTLIEKQYPQLTLNRRQINVLGITMLCQIVSISAKLCQTKPNIRSQFRSQMTYRQIAVNVNERYKPVLLWRSLRVCKLTSRRSSVPILRSGLILGSCRLMRRSRRLLFRVVCWLLRSHEFGGGCRWGGWLLGHGLVSGEWG